VLGVIRIKFPQILHAIHEFGDPGGDMVIAVEAKGSVSYGLGPI